MFIRKKAYLKLLDRMDLSEYNEGWARDKISDLRKEIKWYRSRHPTEICVFSNDPVKHLFNANRYCFVVKNQDGSFSVCENKRIKKGSIVKVYDADTGELLETERGDFIFEVGADYSGESRLPFFL